MSNTVKLIPEVCSDYPNALQKKDISARYPRIWTIGNLDILDKKLLGFFCSVKCPGNTIIKTYDLARALRDNGITVISGFHSPIEKDCLDILIKGNQPIVICPARGIENMRIPRVWRKALSEDRLLVLSPFEPKYRRLTAKLAEQRNRLVATLADKIFIAHADQGSGTERFYAEIITLHKPVYTFDISENKKLKRRGIIKRKLKDLVFELL